jgi:hypothetical protein
MAHKERRKYPRVAICDPISYLCLESNGETTCQNMGAVQNASQNGIKIETYEAIDTEFTILMFVDLGKNLVEIKGKVIYCRKTESGKFESGISLQGSSEEKIEFVKKLVRSYHFNKKDNRKFLSCSNHD